MGGLSLPHLIILALVVLILFGRGRISEMMGDFGKGIRSFKQGINDETDRPATAPPRLEQQPANHVPPQTIAAEPLQQPVSRDPVAPPAPSAGAERRPD